MLTTCQICGRAIKSIVRGRIAHHGYRRPGHGWQTASCHGAKHLPYEVSRDAILPYRDALKSLLEEMQVKCAELVGNPPLILTLRVKRDAWDKVGKLVEYTRPDSFYAKRRRELEQMIRSLSEDIKFLTDRYDIWVAVEEAA